MSKPRSYWSIRYENGEPVGVSFDPGGKRHPEKGDPRMQHNGGELLDLIRQAQRDERERLLALIELERASWDGKAWDDLAFQVRSALGRFRARIDPPAAIAPPAAPRRKPAARGHEEEER